jgi:hypothetical protein
MVAPLGEPPAPEEASPHGVRAVERRAWRRTQAWRRTGASGHALRASARARGGARMAAAPWGPETPGSAPARASRPRCPASWRAVWTRSPACVGLRVGAPPPQASPLGGSARARRHQAPRQRRRGGEGLCWPRAEEGLARTLPRPQSASGGHGRAVLVGAIRAGPGSWVPIHAETAWARRRRGARRAWAGDVATSGGTGCGPFTRGTSGGNLPPLEVIMSRRRGHCSGSRNTQIIQSTIAKETR